MIHINKSTLFPKEDRFRKDKLELSRKSFSPSPNSYTTESFVDQNKK